MSATRRLGFVLPLLALLALVLTATTTTAAHASADYCQQAYASTYYQYDSQAAVPDGASDAGVSRAAVMFGPLAGVGSCNGYADPLEVRQATLTDPGVTTTLTLLAGPFDATAAPSCSGTLRDANGTVLQTVDMPNTPDNTPGLVDAGNAVDLDPAVVAALPLDTVSTLTAHIDCGSAGAFDPTMTITSLSPPSSTSLTMSQTSARVPVGPRHRKASVTVSGRLSAAKAGADVSNQKVVIQHHTVDGWSKIGQDYTGLHGGYTVTTTDTTHRLRAKFPATLRLWGSLAE